MGNVSIVLFSDAAKRMQSGNVGDTPALVSEV